MQMCSCLVFHMIGGSTVMSNPQQSASDPIVFAGKEDEEIMDILRAKLLLDANKRLLGAVQPGAREIAGAPTVEDRFHEVLFNNDDKMTDVIVEQLSRFLVSAMPCALFRSRFVVIPVCACADRLRQR